MLLPERLEERGERYPDFLFFFDMMEFYRSGLGLEVHTA
jgi:hypothetical protein